MSAATVITPHFAARKAFETAGEVAATLQPDEPVFSLGAVLGDPLAVGYESLSQWSFRLEGLVEGVTDITLSILHEGHADFSSPPIAVADHGPGIPDAIESKIFTPFFTTRPTGTGLGLPVVQRIAEAHGGTLTHRPTPGGGATFELRLPRAPRTPALG